jgi:cytochrome c553
VLRIAALVAAILLSPVCAQDEAVTTQLAATCAACHGPDGNSTNPIYPILAGQSWRYIYIQLKDFNEGRRKDPQMSPVAANLTKDQMMALGNHFAAQKQKPIGFKADAGRVAAGRKLNDTVLCPMCHLGDFVGQNEIPRVAGQWPQYVKKQLEDFRARRRTNDGGNMTSVSAGLSDDDIESLSQYIANLY